jgi:outer membrane protein TolC
MKVKHFVTVTGVVVAANAYALQPLEEFLRGARTDSTDNIEARAARRQSDAEADVALGGALPRLSVGGQYLRNQYESVEFFSDPAGGPPIPRTVAPYDQLQAVATLEVPLIDLARFARIGAARSSARASASREAATDLSVQSQVIQNYFQLVANLALVESSRRALEVAQASLRIAEARYNAGSAPLLDVDRARAEVERNVQQLATADLQASVAARALQSLTSITPALDAPIALADVPATGPRDPGARRSDRKPHRRGTAGEGAASIAGPYPQRERDGDGRQFRRNLGPRCVLASWGRSGLVVRSHHTGCNPSAECRRRRSAGAGAARSPRRT